MEIKEIYVEAKRSKNFQTHTVGVHVRIKTEEESKNFEQIIKDAQDKVNKLALRQIE